MLWRLYSWTESKIMFRNHSTVFPSRIDYQWCELQLFMFFSQPPIVFWILSYSYAVVFCNLRALCPIKIGLQDTLSNSERAQWWFLLYVSAVTQCMSTHYWGMCWSTLCMVQQETSTCQTLTELTHSDQSSWLNNWWSITTNLLWLYLYNAHWRLESNVSRMFSKILHQLWRSLGLQWSNWLARLS